MLSNVNPKIKLISYILFNSFLFVNVDIYLTIYVLTLGLIVIFIGGINKYDVVKILKKTLILLIFMWVVYYRIFKDINMSFIYIIKTYIFILYSYCFIKSITLYDVSKYSSRIISLVDIFGIFSKKITNSILSSLLYIKIGFEYFSDLVVLSSLRGIDLCYSPFYKKYICLLKNFKSTRKNMNSRMKVIKNSLKTRKYNSYASIYKYDNKLRMVDYLYLALHIIIVIMYAWRIRV